MSRPGARLGLITYWFVLHIWLLGTILWPNIWPSTTTKGFPSCVGICIMYIVTILFSIFLGSFIDCIRLCLLSRLHWFSGTQLLGVQRINFFSVLVRLYRSSYRWLIDYRLHFFSFHFGTSIYILSLIIFLSWHKYSLIFLACWICKI